MPVAASPTVRRLARQMGIDLATVTARLPGGRLSVEDLEAAGHDGGAFAHPVPSRPADVSGDPAALTPSSPRARRAARHRGIDIATVRGGGAGGRVRERDVLAAADGLPAARVPEDEVAGGRRIPITPTRRTIARQMVRSRQETVPVMLTAWADATALLTLRAANKAAAGPEAPTFNDMLLKALGDTLVAHPLLAARWEETHLSLPGERIDIGLAVDAPGGLGVPVVRDVAASPLVEVARQTRGLVERARAGRLVAAEMQGGVFTLTSLGSYGVEFFTPVINHPQAAILGVGALRTQPVPPLDGREGVAFARQLPLSLTFDHRIVDGGPAARFLGDLVSCIESFRAG
ncbi:MAG: dihydrolipoamide acetyltransferase family protein [Planctomycetia bacterium]